MRGRTDRYSPPPASLHRQRGKDHRRRKSVRRTETRRQPCPQTPGTSLPIKGHLGHHRCCTDPFPTDIAVITLASTVCAPCSRGWPTWVSGPPVQRRSASVRVSDSGSVSDQRGAASVGLACARAARGTRSVLPRTAHELAHPHALAHAARDPRPAGRPCWAARNYPTDSS